VSGARLWEKCRSKRTCNNIKISYIVYVMVYLKEKQNDAEQASGRAEEPVPELGSSPDR
jgi:hypothetical protein